MGCDCDCHKQENGHKLMKCEQRNKAKDKKIKALEKKILTLTLIAAVIGTLIGKEAVDEVVSWFESVNEVRSVIEEVTVVDETQSIPFYPTYGISPAPSTLAVFGLLVLMPRRRRR